MQYGKDPIKNAKMRVDRIKKQIYAAEGGHRRKNGWRSKKYRDKLEALKKAEQELARLMAPPKPKVKRTYKRVESGDI